MKRIITTIVFATSFTLSLSYSQVARIHIADNGKASTLLQVSSPYKGYIGKGELFKKEYAIDTINGINLDISERGGGLYVFRVAPVEFTLMLTPSDTLDVKIRIDSNDFKYAFKGTNAKGHELWMRYTFPKSDLIRHHESILEQKEVEGLRRLTETTLSMMKSINHKFDSLEKKGEVSHEFVKSTNCWLNSFLGWDFISYNIDVKNRRWKVVKPYAERILDYAIKNDSLRYPNGIKIISRFYGDDYYADTSKGKVSKMILPHFFQEALFIPSKNSAREFAFAELIYFYASNGYDEVGWDKAFKYYKQLYPQTALSIRLDSLLKPYKIKKEVVYKSILEKEYETLDDLLSEFRGSYLFVDLWATWCMPCRLEMRMDVLKPLSAELEKRNIKKLYLSIDDDERANSWKRTIDILKLNGYHHRVGKILYNDIQLRIYGNDSFGVPRYLLFGKNGELLSINLPRPSTGQKLLDEIDRLLK